MADVPLLVRDLTPFEHLVLGMVCEGKSNAAIARDTAHSEKVVENTVSRAARAFNLQADGQVNIRVMLALAYRTHFGDHAFDRMGVECQHSSTGPNGERMCTSHV
jgi:DNA-binding NarL/FixJ family response regulator